MSSYTPRTDVSTSANGRGPGRQRTVKLLAHHLADLRQSGLSDEQIRACGFHSARKPSRVRRILNWSHYNGFLGACLAIPYFDHAGKRTKYVRLKPDTPRTEGDDKLIKYESPMGRPNLAYFPPATRPVLFDPAVPLVITEGEKKAAKADQEGFPCIGLVGVCGFLKKRPKDERGKPIGDVELIDGLSAVSWEGRTVYICYDSDAATNKKVLRAQRQLAEVLVRQGAVVKVVRLPSGADGAKVGLDDYLVAYGADAFRGLMAAATAATTADALPTNESVDDPDRLARLFLEARYHHADGPTLRYHHEEWCTWNGAAYERFPTSDLCAELWRFIRAEFERENREKLARAQTDDADSLKTRRPTVQKVTGALVSNTERAIRSLTIVPESCGDPAWIGDAEPFPATEMLACANGLVHLPSLWTDESKIRQATPTYFTYSALDYAFDLDAPAPSCWLKFLGQTWPDDRQSTELLQEWFGLNLIRDTSYQKILLMVGPRRAGKGTIARVLKALVGEMNCDAASLDSLCGEFGLWPLLDKPTAIMSDARLDRRRENTVVMERLLSISGEDAVPVNRKNLSIVSAKLPTRFAIVTNELPRFDDPSGALASRFLVLRFTESWLNREDRGLSARLLRELPGILLWAIAGLRRLQERGSFVQPSTGDDIVDELLCITSPIQAFIADRCVLGPEQSVARQRIYQAWVEWCSTRRNFPGDDANLGISLRAAVATIRDHRPKINGERVRIYTGIGLNGDAPVQGPSRVGPG